MEELDGLVEAKKFLAAAQGSNFDELNAGRALELQSWTALLKPRNFLQLLRAVALMI